MSDWANFPCPVYSHLAEMILQAWTVAKHIIVLHSDSEPEISHCSRETEAPPEVLHLHRGTWKDCGVAQLI